jgi:hypothetical protein
MLYSPDSSDLFPVREAEGWKGVESLGNLLPMRVYKIEWHFKKQSHGESVRFIGVATDVEYKTWVLTVCRPRHTEKNQPYLIQAFRKLDVPCTQDHVASSFLGEMTYNSTEIAKLKLGKKRFVNYGKIIPDLLTEINEKITPFVFTHVPMTNISHRMMMFTDE